MFRLIVLLALAWPACAQFQTIDISFEGVGCASCVESLSSRMQRIRGVESATVDAASGELHLKLAVQNRVRLEQIRDAIEQDGTKVRQATVSVIGMLKSEAGKWLLAPGGLPTSYIVDDTKVEAGQMRVNGVVSDVHAGPPLTIRASKVEKAE